MAGAGSRASDAEGGADGLGHRRSVPRSEPRTGAAILARRLRRAARRLAPHRPLSADRRYTRASCARTLAARGSRSCSQSVARPIRQQPSLLGARSTRSKHRSVRKSLRCRLRRPSPARCSAGSSWKDAPASRGPRSRPGVARSRWWQPRTSVRASSSSPSCAARAPSGRRNRAGRRSDPIGVRPFARRAGNRSACAWRWRTRGAAGAASTSSGSRRVSRLPSSRRRLDERSTRAAMKPPHPECARVGESREERHLAERASAPTRAA